MSTLVRRSAYLLVTIAAALCVAAPAAQAVDTPFTNRFAKTVRGNISSVGNMLLTCPAGVPACVDALNRVGTGGALNNNNYVMQNVDIDAVPGTFNSSSATVSLPANSVVEWAGLYWSADTSAGAGGGAAAPNAALKDTVSFAVDGGAYQTLSAAPADVLTSTPQPSRYRAFRDVTALLPTAGDGTYTVANVQAGTGMDRFAGWALIVAYRDVAQDLRRLNVYDGLGTVDSSHTFSTTIAPFQTPATGPVDTTVGLLAFEGDAGIASETATFNGVAFANGLNPADNTMNSTMSANGVLQTAKTPNHANQLGSDLDSIFSTGFLANSQSSAVLAFSSTSEYFMPSALYIVSDEGPPNNTSAPTITGAPRDGSTLTANPGGWAGTPALVYHYQWQACDATGLVCTDIPGATNDTYVLAGPDVGSRIRVVVIVSNDAGSSDPAASGATDVVAAMPPLNVSPPSFSTTDGEILTADPGVWEGTGPLTFDFQWQRCDADGSNCVDIVGATESSYTRTSDDDGHSLRIAVTASNAAGRGAQSSATVASPACQQLTGNAVYKRVRVAGIGTVRVRAYTAGPVLGSSPVQVTTRIAGGSVKAVSYRLDGRPLAGGRGAHHIAGITAAQLGRVGSHKLATRLVPRRGHAKTVVISLKTVVCGTVFSAQRWRTTVGTGLRLRVDARTALRQIAFAVPAALLPRKSAQRRVVGFIRIYTAGQSAHRRFDLVLPRRGAATIGVPGAGRMTVRIGRSGVVVNRLPAGASVAELTFYRVTSVDGATTGRTPRLRATITRAGAAGETLSQRPRAPR